MTKQEFETRLGKHVPQKHYELIEFVYMYHPCISNTDGKTQVANLYDMCGLQIFRDMERTAKEAQTLEEEIRKLNAEIETKKTKLIALQMGEQI